MLLETTGRKEPSKEGNEEREGSKTKRGPRSRNRVKEKRVGVTEPLPKTRSCVNEFAPCSGDDASSLPRIAHFRQVRTVLKQRSQWSLTDLGTPEDSVLKAETE